MQSTADKHFHEKTTFAIYGCKKNQKFAHIGLKENMRYDGFKITVDAGTKQFLQSTAVKKNHKFAHIELKETGTIAV